MAGDEVRLDHRFGSGLVTRQAMQEVIRALVDSSSNHMVLLKRSRLNVSVGQMQSPRAVIRVADNLNTAGLDERLVRARSVSFIIETSDGGAALVELTDRKWSVWQASPEVSVLLRQTQKNIREGRAGQTLFGWRAQTAVLAGYAYCVGAYLTISYKHFGAFVFPANEDGSVQIPTPPGFALWVAVPFALVTIALLTLGVLLALLTLMSTGLRVWPEAFTLRSLVANLHRLRATGGFPGRQVAWLGTTFLAGVLAALATRWFG